MNKACVNSFEYSWTCRWEMSSRRANSQKRSNNTHHVSSNGEYKIYNSKKLDFSIAKSERPLSVSPPSKSESTPWDENERVRIPLLVEQARDWLFNLEKSWWRYLGRSGAGAVLGWLARTPPPYLPVFPFHFPLPVESLRYDSHNPGLTPSQVLDDSSLF